MTVRTLNPFFQKTCSYVPSNGHPSQYLLPVSPPTNRAVHLDYSTSPEHSAPPSFTQRTHLWARPLGANGTLSLLKDRFWWPNMARDVRRFVQGCPDCAISKNPRHLPSGKLLPLARSKPTLVTSRSGLHNGSPTF